MKTIKDIDVNFTNKSIDNKNIKWVNVLDSKASIYGVFYDYNMKQFLRLPYEFAKSVNPGEEITCKHTAGGRIRFKTNSKFIALHVKTRSEGLIQSLTIHNQYGISIYEDNEFYNLVAFPESKSIFDNLYQDFEYEFIGNFMNFNEIHEITLHLPLYGEIKELYIGVDENSFIKKDSKYKYNKEVVFYGSSITQGACATRPGVDYINIISKKLNMNYLNYGSSGSCLAEENMAHYLANLHLDTYVLDYDYNAPTVEYLENTHERLYKIIREENKDASIILISAPTRNHMEDGITRYNIIKKTYDNAIKNNDHNIYLINGMEFFKGVDTYSKTDEYHPNDHGFYLMAETISKVLKKCLKK